MNALMLRVKTMSDPAATPGRLRGRMTRRKVWNRIGSEDLRGTHHRGIDTPQAQS